MYAKHLAIDQPKPAARIDEMVRFECAASAETTDHVVAKEPVIRKLLYLVSTCGRFEGRGTEENRRHVIAVFEFRVWRV